jgi:hypothetical protein
MTKRSQLESFILNDTLVRTIPPRAHGRLVEQRSPAEIHRPNNPEQSSL